MKIQSKFMTGLVSRIVKKVLRTKLSCEVDIQLNEFRTTVIDDKTHVHLDLDADLTKEELNKLMWRGRRLRSFRERRLPRSIKR